MKATNAAPKLRTDSFGTMKSAPAADMNSDTEMVVLPDPVGHHMLIALPIVETKTASGLLMLDAVTERERAAVIVGVVLAMGDGCYADIRRFGIDTPEGRVLQKPWCKVGDTVMFGARYQGMRFRSLDPESGAMVEYRMLTDDGICGNVPRGAIVGGI